MGVTVTRRAQPAVHLKLLVNGEETEVSFAPYKTLLEVLREELALTGTKHGCELGECGACAVLVAGEPAPSGQTRFADDIVLPRMLHCGLLRSPHAHALIESIDTSRAEAYPGVHLVLTGKDFPISFGILPVTQDEYALAPRTVRYVGDPLAAV